MIKINLLKSYNVQDSEVIQQIEQAAKTRQDFYVRFLVLFLGPIVLYLYEMYNIPEMKKQLFTAQAEVAQLADFNSKKESIAKEIKKYEEDKKRITKQKQFLEKIAKERTSASLLLLTLREQIPDGVWINGITVKGTKIEIKGEGDNESKISKFEQNLISVPTLKDVKLLNIEIKNDKIKTDVNIYTFVVNGEFASEVPHE